MQLGDSTLENSRNIAGYWTGGSANSRNKTSSRDKLLRKHARRSKPLNLAVAS